MSLLDFLSSDDAQLGMNLLAAGGPSTDPNMGFGARLAGAVGATRASRDANDDRKLKQAYLQAQIDAKEQALIDAADKKARWAQYQKALGGGFMAAAPGGGGAGGAPGGAGAAGGPPPAISAAVSQGNPVDIASMSPNQVMLLQAMAKDVGAPDPVEIWKASKPETAVHNGYAYNKNDPTIRGFLPGVTVSANGQAIGTMQGPDGRVQVYTPTGADAAQRGSLRIGEEEKNRFNMREVIDTDPTSPTYKQKVLRSTLDIVGGGGGGSGGGAAPSAPYAPVIGRSPPAGAIPAARGAFVGSPEQVLADIEGANVPPAVKAQMRAAYAAQVSGTNPAYSDLGTGIQAGPVIGAGAGRGSINPGGAPAAVPPAIARPPGAAVVELSASQQADDKAAEAAKIEKAKGEVVTKQAKQTALNTGNDMLRTIDKVLTHPGLEAGTGINSKVDPRNLVPGTDAYNFAVARKQLQGQAFLQAFQSLKGAGAITETEGTKAEQAIARLDNAQSKDEYLAALTDLKSVVARGLKVTRGESVPDEPLPSAGKRSVADLLKQYGGK